MIPTAAEVVRRRWVLVAVVRLFAILLGLLSAWPFASWMMEGYHDGDVLDYGYYSLRIAGTLVLAAAGMGCFGAAPRLVRWLTPVPSVARCPRCGYRVAPDAPIACPECGLDVSSMRAQEAAPIGDEAWRARAVAATTTVLRVASTLSLLFAIAYAVLVAVDMIVWFGWQVAMWSPLEYTSAFVPPIVAILTGAALGMPAPWLARRLVPEPIGGSKAPEATSQTAVGGDDARGEHSDGDPSKSRSAG